MDFFTYERQQFPWYRTMRATMPVHYREKDQIWEVFRYQDVLSVLSEPEQFSSDFQENADPEQFFGPTMIATDPPQHTQLRGLVAHDFTPRTVARLAPRITDIAHTLLDQIAPTGTMDVVTDFANPLPVIVIAEILGVPAQERLRFKAWSDALISGSAEERQQMRRRRGVHGLAAAARDEMRAYFEDMIEQRRSQPQDDLISRLLAAQIDGRSLTQQELLGFCALLLIAGNITTTNLISNAILCFDEHPEVIERMRAEPALLAGAIEEVLRYRSPAQFTIRRTTTATRVGEQDIPADQTIIAWLHSANHDEAEFPAPERFDIERTPNRHVAFGHDIHFCLGAHLARLEAKLALSAMLERLPDMRRTTQTSPELLDSAIIYGVKQLPLTFTASPASAAKEPVHST